MNFNISLSLRGLKIAPLPEAITPAAIHDGVQVLDAPQTKRALLDMTTTLLIIDNSSKLWATPPSSPYKVSLVTLYERLCTGKSAPESLPYDSSQYVPQAQRPQTSKAAAKAAVLAAADDFAFHRPLAHFEDLYYTIIAKVKDMHFHLKLRLENGFAAPDTPICPGGPEIGDVESVLRQYWEAVNNPVFVKAINEAVQVENMWKARRAEPMAHLTTSSTMAINASTSMKKARMSGDATVIDGKDVPGLIWMHSLAPGMIFAELEEKYRALFAAEKAQQEEKEQEQKQQAEAQSTHKRKPSMTKHKSITTLRTVTEKSKTAATAMAAREERRTKRKRDPPEIDNYEREKAWRNGYGEGGDAQHREALKKDFIRLAKAVQYWGRKKRSKAFVQE